MEVFPSLRIHKDPGIFMTCLLTHCLSIWNVLGTAPRYLLPFPVLLIFCPPSSPLLQYLLPLLETIYYRNGPHCPQDLPKEVSFPAERESLTPSSIFSLYWGHSFTYSFCHFHPFTLKTHANLSLRVRNDILSPASLSFHFLCYILMIWEHPQQPHICFSQGND